MKPKAYILFHGLLFTATATCQQIPEGLLDVDTAILRAFEANKDLAIAELEIKRAKSRLRWSGRLSNPSLGISARSDHFGIDEGERAMEFSFTQRFPITSRLRIEKSLRNKQVILAEAETAEHRRNLAADIAGVILDLTATHYHEEHQREHAALKTSMSKNLRDLVDRGEASELELAQIQIEARHIQQKGRIYKARQDQHQIKLNHLLGADSQIQNKVSFFFDLPDKNPNKKIDLTNILIKRPDHILALSRIETASEILELEKALKWEDVALKVFVQSQRSMDEPIGVETNTFAGLGLSIPLPIRKKNEGGIEQAEVNEEAARLEAAAVRFKIQSEYASASKHQLDSWQIAQEANGEILRLARKNYDDFRLAYLEGLTGLIQVQRAHERLLELEHAALEAKIDYHKATLLVRKATGDFPN